MSPVTDSHWIWRQEINLLRLWIRQSPSTSSMEYDSLLISISLIEDNIRDLVILAGSGLPHSLVGFYLSSTLAENIGQLLDICHQSSSHQASEALRTLEVGCQLLQTLSQSSPRASMAISGLRGSCLESAATSIIFERVWGDNDGGIPLNISEGCQKLHSLAEPLPGSQPHDPRSASRALPDLTALESSGPASAASQCSQPIEIVSGHSPRDQAMFRPGQRNSSEALPEILEETYGELDFG